MLRILTVRIMALAGGKSCANHQPLPPRTFGMIWEERVCGARVQGLEGPVVGCGGPCLWAEQDMRKCMKAEEPLSKAPVAFPILSNALFMARMSQQAVRPR